MLITPRSTTSSPTLSLSPSLTAADSADFLCGVIRSEDVDVPRDLMLDSDAWLDAPLDFQDAGLRKIIEDTMPSLKRVLCDGGATSSPSKKRLCRAESLPFDEEQDDDVHDKKTVEDVFLDGTFLEATHPCELTSFSDFQVELDFFALDELELPCDNKTAVPRSPSSQSQSDFPVFELSESVYSLEPANVSADLPLVLSKTNKSEPAKIKASCPLPPPPTLSAKPAAPVAVTAGGKKKRLRPTVAERRQKMEQRAKSLDERNAFLRAEIEVASAELLECKKLIAELYKMEGEKAFFLKK